MTKKFYFLTALLLTVAVALSVAAETVTIPTADGTFIDWRKCDLQNAQVENNGENIGSTHGNTVATFTIQNDTQQDFILTFKTAANNLTGEIDVTLTNSSDSKVFEKVAQIKNTGSWYFNGSETVHTYLISQLPADTYTLKFATKSTTSSYAGNWGYLQLLATDSYNKAPGTIGIATGTYNGPKLENNNTNVGYVSNDGTASYSFICSEGGVYKMTTPMRKYGDGTIHVTVTNDETGNVEADGTWTVDANTSDYADVDIPIDGELTTGLKILQLSFATENSFLCNYKDITMTRIANHYAKIAGVTVTGQETTSAEGCDWFIQLPASYNATTTFSVDAKYGTVAASSEGVEITDNGNGTFTLATPTPGTTISVTLTLTPADGTISGKTIYTLKLFRIGEISIVDATVDGVAIGEELLATLNDKLAAEYQNVYTTMPAVKMQCVDGTWFEPVAATEEKPNPVIDGAKATYTFHITMADKEKDYTLTIDGVHIYNKEEGDETVDIKANGGTIENNTWSNGIYTLTTNSLDSYNEFFKMNGSSYTLSLPAGVVVKQLIMKDCSNNYANNDARLTAVTSEGATAYIPADNKYYHSSEGPKHDIIVNIDHHTAGADIVLTQPKLGQPMAWIQLTIEKQNPGTAPKKTGESVTVNGNHAVVAVSFDREIAGDVTASVLNGSAVESTVTAEGGAATLYFAVWNLDYNQQYTLTIAPGAVKDAFGNANTEAVEVVVKTDAKTVVAQAAYDFVIGTVDELKAAFTAVNESNTKADADRKVIFIKNGDYNLGDFVGQGKSCAQLKCYNVSLIGESREGVIIHGDADGISNPVLNLRDRSGFYLQDLTVRNDRDFGNGLFNGGVAVAIYGGDKTVMKNVCMQSNQDTQVTGHRGYFEDCKIHGTVDFICGGGDNFYSNTDLILENREGDVISAPSTSSAHKWGYVFDHCTIMPAEGATVVTDGSWNLGRPWQNEPRTYYLYTKMDVLPSAGGWASMGALVTHFYEYASIDKDGNVVDLSVRKNSPTSTNTYVPVLTDEEAQKYTLENVLGGTDSWLPTEECAETAAPVVSVNDEKVLSWQAVEDARCYVILKDGNYVANVATTSWQAPENGIYTVRSANKNGGLFGTSAEVEVKDATGIIEARSKREEASCEIYNLNGQRVANGQLKKGLYIVNGKKTAIK